MDRITKLVSGRLTAQPAPGPHPDVELLSAFTENALPEADRGPLLQHLGACSDCREILYLALPDSPEAQKVLVLQPRPFRRWVFGWGAVVASVAIVAILFSFSVPRLEHKNQTAPTVAAVPAAPAETRIAGEKSPPELDHLHAARDGKTTNMATALDKGEAKPRPEAKHMTAELQSGLVFEDAGEVHLQAPAAPANAAGAPVSKDNDDKDKYRDERKKENPAVAETSGSATQTGSAGKLGSFGRATTELSKSRADQKAAAGQETGVLADAVSQLGPAQTSNQNVQVASQAVEVEAAAPTAGANSFSVSAADRVALKRAIALPKWSLTSAGEIQRSLDHGKTWLLTQPAPGVVFRAISSVGPQVWAAGNGGALYHSADSGLIWTRLTVKVDGKHLQDDFTAIDFTDAVHGHVKTGAGADFTTSDGGQNWQRK